MAFNKSRGNKSRQDRAAENREKSLESWKPKTELGKNVKAGKITGMDDIWAGGKIIKEPEIADFFLPGLEERVLKIGRGKRPFKWVQRMTDSGRRNTYCVVAVVGNKNGYVGIGRGCGKEYGSAIKQGVRKAKLSMTKVDRGCGSWDCGCGGNHSVSRDVNGKTGSIMVTLKPAPKGTGIAANAITKDILELGGVKDIWSSTKGHTRSRENLAFATFEAIKNLKRLRGVVEKKKAPEEKKVEAKPAEEGKKREEKAVKKDEKMRSRAKELREKTEKDLRKEVRKNDGKEK